MSGKPVTGAIRGRNTYKIVSTGATFTGTLTDFEPREVGRPPWRDGVPNPTAARPSAGTGTIISGAGIYKGATGRFTFKGSDPAKDADGDNDAVIASFKTTGSLTY